ncbi:unnamed protein product [Rotaria sp. Silwood2]|nr:unnamed protein product [Rotaria sp. Silwood2]CAF4386420.1 unnamed protein product [Rotaria sp. Silwood2]
MAGVGWNGGSWVNASLDGLTFSDYKTILNNVVRLGHNTIRISFYDRGVLNDTPMNGVDYSIGSNSELKSLTYLGCLDRIIDYCGTIGLRVVFVSHNNEGGHGSADNYGSSNANGLWYDVGGASDGTDGGGNPGTISDALWINVWETIARRWKNKPAILGYDLRNEPASYGSLWEKGVGSNRNIRYAYERAGNAIHAIDPRPLIICEGPQDYSENFANTWPAAPEGDLSLVQQLPVNLVIPNKVVYSVHEYSNVVNKYTGPDSGPEYIARMNANWGYLYQTNIAPVWIGEMGQWLTTSADFAYADTLVSYLNGQAPGGIKFSGSEQGVGTSWWNLNVNENFATQPPFFGIWTSWNNPDFRPDQKPYLLALQQK